MQNKPIQAQQTKPNLQRIDLQHVEWIAGRAQVLLSHYFQPNMPQDQQMAVIDDWVDALAEFPREKIQSACAKYIKDEPTKRPTPGAIVRLICDKRTWRDKPEHLWTDRDRTEWAKAML